MAKLKDLCTFRRNGVWCGRVEEDETDHVWPDERMRPGAHVWRHDQRDEPGLSAFLGLGRERDVDVSGPRSPEWRRGYQAGYHAGRRRVEAADR